MRFRQIQIEQANHPVGMMCRLLRVSRSGYYASLKRRPSLRSQSDLDLAVEIESIFRKSRGTYGSPRIHEDLKQAGYRVGRKRVARMMRFRALYGRTRRRFRPVSPDLAETKRIDLVKRKFTRAVPNAVWLTDITSLWTREGWLFVVAFLDLFSRRIVGWRAGDSPDATMCIGALEDAVRLRQPNRGFVVHSDQGSQYTSDRFQSAVYSRGGVSSMSRPGNCWDNAPMESFWSSMKTEMGHRIPATLEEGKQKVFDYIDAFYNSQRRHSSIQYLSPINFERQHKSQNAV